MSCWQEAGTTTNRSDKLTIPITNQSVTMRVLVVLSNSSKLTKFTTKKKKLEERKGLIYISFEKKIRKKERKDLQVLTISRISNFRSSENCSTIEILASFRIGMHEWMNEEKETTWMRVFSRRGTSSINYDWVWCEKNLILFCSQSVFFLPFFF